jgi:NAD(P)H dehydrogenase (quinone)
MPEVMESDLATEAYLKSSGLVYTILKSGYYFEGLEYLIGSEVPATEIRFPAGKGKVAFVKRTELAAAMAPCLLANILIIKSIAYWGAGPIRFTA